MEESVALCVENLCKSYPLNQPKEDQFGVVQREHKALINLSLTVFKGEIVGIVGPNGSGKSTFLKIVAGITKPTAGSVSYKGKIASILDLGAGFHPDLSGRENVFLNGQILGFSKKEISKKLDAIIEFSGIKHFINEPIKNYSSGMYVRLAFSIMANLEFDLYLLDEVISVGDEEFRKKIIQQILQWKKKKTVILITHDLVQIAPYLDRVFEFGNQYITEYSQDAATNLTIDKLVEQYKFSNGIVSKRFTMDIETKNYALNIQCVEK